MSSENRLARVALAIAALLLFVPIMGCVTNPATGKKDLILIGTAEEVRMGSDFHAKMLQDFKPVTSAPYSKRSLAIGEKIAAVSDRQDIAYSFTVVEADDMNAFAVPGGFVYVTTGLMRSADEDELAAVVGHEVGHIAARHSVKQMQTAMAASLLLVLVSENTDKDEYVVAAAAAFQLVMLGYSRRDEYEADLLGARYAWRSGYSPYGMSSFLQKLQKANQNSGSLPEFLSTHPDLGKRVGRVNEVIRNEMLRPDGNLLPPPAMQERPQQQPEVTNPS